VFQEGWFTMHEPVHEWEVMNFIMFAINWRMPCKTDWELVGKITLEMKRERESEREGPDQTRPDQRSSSGCDMKNAIKTKSREKEVERK